MNEGNGVTLIMPTSRYQQYGGSSSGGSNSGDSDDEKTLKFRPHAAVRGTFDRVFGTSSQYGQSLGAVMTDVSLLDGALYLDPEKGKYKLFSWSDVSGMDPLERLERGQEPTADDAPEVETRSYPTGEKRYELVAARVEPIEDDGDVVVAADSKERNITSDGDTLDIGDWQDRNGEPVGIGDTLTWWDGSDEYGPSSASQQMVELVTQYGEDGVIDAGNIDNWLPDDSGGNILRDDLEGRDVEFFLDVKTSDNGRNYHVPVLVDASTGAKITPNNVGGGSGNSNPRSEQSGDTGSDESSEPDAIEMARELDASDQPEPVADFIRSGESLTLTEDRADALLTELLEDPSNAMTEEMVEEAGGHDTLVQRVVPT